MKEFERISGLKIAEVKKDRIAALRTFVKEYDVTCVLKDSRTTIAKPRERVAVNLSGCAAMNGKQRFSVFIFTEELVRL